MSIYDYKVKDMLDWEVSLNMYKGKVLLIVNTAIKCGFTPQYTGLQDLYLKYKDKGFEILDFPCNQFFAQAPGTDISICDFRKNKYKITFPQFKKINVNGKDESPLYTYLKSVFKGSIKWNFTKFLVDKKGNVVQRYGSSIKPADIEQDILKLL